MNGRDVAQASSLHSEMRRPGSLRHLGPAQRRQIAFITLGAIAVFAFLRWLPTGTNLSHMDFRVEAKNSIDFCDPLNPQFIPVVAVASPVTMQLAAPPATAGQNLRATIRLRTASGKPIAPADLLVVHTQRLHLLIIDPTLADYQHVHPTAGAGPGEWTFDFTPKLGGMYRIFADFTPAATNRGLYANTELSVDTPGKKATGTDFASATNWSFEKDGYHFVLTPSALPLRARQPADLKFSVERPDGGRVALEPVMGAFAHLVAFDEARSGFAHLHPMQANLAEAPDAIHPTLDFKITIPKAGRYVIWAQVNLGGHEAFVPFWFTVAP